MLILSTDSEAWLLASGSIASLMRHGMKSMAHTTQKKHVVKHSRSTVIHSRRQAMAIRWVEKYRARKLRARLDAWKSSFSQRAEEYRHIWRLDPRTARFVLSIFLGTDDKEKIELLFTLEGEDKACEWLCSTLGISEDFLNKLS
jgi:hypothetical protein